MKWKASRMISSIALLGLLVFTGWSDPSGQAQVESKKDDWPACTVCRIDAVIALNSAPGPTIVPRRHIYLLLQPSTFSAESLRKLFHNLSVAYPEPVLLSITALSNKVYLQKMIDAVETTVIIDFADTPEGRKMREAYYARQYPPKTGYFQAYYVRRSPNDESFQYTPNPELEDTVEVIISKPN